MTYNEQTPVAIAAADYAVHEHRFGFETERCRCGMTELEWNRISARLVLCAVGYFG